MFLSSPHASSAELTLQYHPSENYHGFSDWLTSQAILERETEASMPPLRLHCLELCMLAFAEVRGQESSGGMYREINFKKWVPRTLLGDWPGKLTGSFELLMPVLSWYSHLQVLSEIYRLGLYMQLTSLFSLSKYSQAVMQQNSKKHDFLACKSYRNISLFSQQAWDTWIDLSEPESDKSNFKTRFSV